MACHVTIFGKYAVYAVCFLHRSICVSDRSVRRSHRQKGQGRQREREAASLCGGRCGSKRVGGHRKPYPHIKASRTIRQSCSIYTSSRTTVRIIPPRSRGRRALMSTSDLIRCRSARGYALEYLFHHIFEDKGETAYRRLFRVRCGQHRRQGLRPRDEQKCSTPVSTPH